MRSPCLKFYFYLRVFFKFFSVEIVMPLGLALHFYIVTMHVARLLMRRGCQVNFPEFTWSVSYFIVKLLMFYKNSSTSHTWGNKHAI